MASTLCPYIAFRDDAREALTADQQQGRIRADLDVEWIIRAGHALADGLQNAWILDPSIDMAADIDRFFALLRA